jgi:hypothetical protein
LQGTVQKIKKSADRKLIQSNTTWTIPTVKKNISPISAVLKTETVFMNAEKMRFTVDLKKILNLFITAPKLGPLLNDRFPTI